MKKNKIIILLICILLLTGCNSSKETEDIDNLYDVTGLSHTTCTRDASVEDSDTTVDIKIDLYSDEAGYLQILKSKEMITSSSNDTLTQYEEAYKSIYKAYANIDYYDNEVLRTDNKVTSTTVIHYGKVDMDKILEIEGEEDNVKVENGKIKLSDWKKFAKEYGTKCN